MPMPFSALSDVERIKQLEARVAELEGNRCRCCTPLVKQTDVYLVEVRTDCEYANGGLSRFARVSSPWGELKVPLSELDTSVAFARLCRPHERGTLRVEFK